MTHYARRLQRIGSSILISLPSEWIKSNKLTKGSTVPIEINRDNTISIFPSQEDADDKTKEVTITYSPASMDTLVNQVYGAYLLGYDMIRIKAGLQISFDDADRIKKAMRKLVGLEIIDEDGLNITAQFLLDENTLDAEKILRRMSSIVAGMYRDVLDAIRSKENSIGRVISGRDDEVDRQYFLLVRLIRSAMMDQKLAGKLNLSNIDILDYRIAANHLESAGDSIVDLASSIHGLARSHFAEGIIEASSLVEKMQEKSVAAFVNQNRSESNNVVKLYENFVKLLNSVKEQATHRESSNPQSTIAVLNMTYSMDNIARCWVDVADLVKPVHLTAPLRNA
ncbi:MAG TPA: phosphate uptake regulator PhoU [Nitrososphaera sp.]|jgi:phosphate uptake regulator|nr:phosphate uptake regulator PhoU [Nitrososphaera sp.]